MYTANNKIACKLTICQLYKPQHFLKIWQNTWSRHHLHNSTSFCELAI